MAWPSSDVNTTALDAGTDTPPRAEFLSWAQKFNELRNHVSVFMRNVLASADAVAARATLDVPSRAGGNATGTWGIAITGNAATATTATNCGRSVSGAGLASGGGALTADRTITVPAATQAQAEAGTDNATAMTPLRTAQAIAVLANPMNTIAAQGAGGVGTYAFLRINSGTVPPGTLVSGASLSWTDGFAESIFNAVGYGTWRCMGYQYVADRGTVYLRVS